jgi:tetratricopeptide (TPR) repeat protein
MNVKAWKEIVKISTYGIGKPEKNPIFLENRVYQGSSGVVYPHPVIEKILDEKEDKEYIALYLENDYLKIMILPELGGRIQMAFDKTKQRHFVYYNQVIKPALVGLTGPWISGGIEFNWPQHHRPSTFEPTEWSIEDNKDGSKTIWCNELERLFRTKAMAGFTLYPDKAYIEIKARLYNRTAQPQTFLWWANPAVHVNEHYQSVFPPDVHAVFDHGKRDVSEFPIAKGTYYKVDYSAGVDISRYENIPVPTSYMAVESKYNFVGGYENDTKGGLLHVANHHVSPGKKQWTWGNSDFGQAWDRNLTDQDGPYIELMCGVFTDNQPDFSWIMPYEERTFSQYFMPYRDLGMVKNASKDAMVNLEFENGIATIKVYTTGIFPKMSICLESHGIVYMNEVIEGSPKGSFEKTVSVNKNLKPEDFRLYVSDIKGKVLVEYTPDVPLQNTVPEAAKPAKLPQEIDSIEQLFLTGQHLEQYRHATFNPTDYYFEALRREPTDARCNNALGLLLFRRGQFVESEPCFREAIKTLIQRNPNPYDGEAYFNLGMSLRYQGRNDEAYAAFYKSVWNVAWQDAGYFNLAQLAGLKNDWEDALELIDHSLVRNWHNHKARHLKAVILRKLDQKIECRKWIEESLQLDEFNHSLRFEKYLIGKDDQSLFKDDQSLYVTKKLMAGNIHAYIEYSIDYCMAGLFEEAQQLLTLEIETQKEVYPMAWYFMGFYAAQQGNEKKAHAFFIKAEAMKPDFCFPNRLEEVLALQCATTTLPKGAKAFYYLGNFWYGARQYPEAIQCWEQSRDLDKTFPTVKRNLALAYYNKLGDTAKALNELESAFKLDTTDARILMELDQLYKKLNRSFQSRLDLLEKYPKSVNERDDLYLERITLHNMTGNHAKALASILKHTFHPWEGGEGKVTGQYIFSHVALAKQAIGLKDFQKAIDHLKATESYPHNLGEGKLYGARENDIHYWLGCAYSGLNDEATAKHYWEKAATGNNQPSTAMFYNDQQPDQIFYQGLALLKLGDLVKAFECFNNLLQHGNAHLKDEFKIDYFAVSLPDLLIWDDNLNRRNEIHCHYLIGLGLLGLGETQQAKTQFQTVISMDFNHTGAQIHQQLKI